MVARTPAVCMKCNHTFTLDEEKSKRTHLLYCVRCGRAKRIMPSDLKDHYLRYLGTLLLSPSAVMQSVKEPVRPLFSGEQLDIRKYAYMVEHLAGSCVCGAVFRFSGKPRCPRCRSAVIRTDLLKKQHDAPVTGTR